MSKSMHWCMFGNFFPALATYVTAMRKPYYTTYVGPYRLYSVGLNLELFTGCFREVS